MKNNDKTTTEKPNKLLKELHALVTEGEKLLRASSSGSREDGDETMGEQLDHAQDRLREIYSDSKKKVTDVASRADSSIRSYPYQSLAIALGAGLLIGALTSRRSS